MAGEHLEGELSPAEELEEMLEVLVSAFSIEGEVVVAVSERDDGIRGELSGPGARLLVGEEGALLDAIQHLAQRIALRVDRGLRLTVEADGYRARREERLRKDADGAADQALRDGRAVPLTPMSAYERRIVHEHLRERGDVVTHSEGEEPQRRLIVAPAA